MSTTVGNKMTLQEELDLNTMMYTDMVPSELMEVIVDAYTRLQGSQIVQRAVKKGDIAPDFALTDTETGREIRSSKLRNRGPLVVCFFRGGWCAYCETQLKAFQRYAEEINAKGATLVAISPQKQELAKETIDKNDLKFHLLNDVDNQISNKYGLTFDLEEPLKAAYKQLKLEIPKINDTDPKWQLPVPATYVIDRNGNVVYACVEAEPWKRPEPGEIVAAIPEQKKFVKRQWLRKLRRRFLVTSS